MDEINNEPYEPLESPDAWLKVMPVLLNNTSKNFVKRILDPDKYPQLDNGDGTFSTHVMSSADNVVFPEVIQDPITKELRRFPHWREAYDYARKSGEYLEFDSPEEAEWFSKNYKSVWKK